MNGSSGLKCPFNSFFSVLECQLILPQAMSSKLHFRLGFIIESIFANYKKLFPESRNPLHLLYENSLLVPLNTAKPLELIYSKIVVPKVVVLKIVMSIFTSIFGSVGLRVVVFELIVPQSVKGSSGFSYNSINWYLPNPSPDTPLIIFAFFIAFITFVDLDFEHPNHS